jgi:ferredoxin
MACVGACPGKALQDGSNREVPEVFFFENNCLQCGACVQTCPEDAITLAPRLLLQREARNRGRALNQDTPFHCIGCGKPFAPTSVISKMQEKLKDHYMFSSERALDRLKMCEDCRVVDIFDDPEAMGGQFDPRTRFRQ